MPPRSNGRLTTLRALGLALIFCVGPLDAPFAQAASQSRRSPAIERMQAQGPEAESLARRAGLWNVVMTLRPTPDATPIVTRDMIAVRKMIGLFLEEVMRPAPGTNAPDFRRISYLTFNRVEGRWQYVSLDTRFPAGIMPARSFEAGNARNLTLEFEGLGFVGFGPEVEGRLVRSNYVVTVESNDREVAQQYWIQADGTGRRWLAVQYEYSRR